MKMISEVEEKTKAKIGAGGVLWRILVVFLILIVAIIMLLYFSMKTIIFGPSKYARDVFVATCMETSFAKYFPPLYLSQEEINEILNKQKYTLPEETTDVSVELETPDEEMKDIELIEITGSTYKGKMLIVKDPSRVYVSTPQNYGEIGLKLAQMIENDKAIAGINGGGFADENGVGNGGTPLGIVISNGVFKYGENAAATNIVGFDNNNLLHVGTMTPQKLKELNIRDAVSFGPAIVINSKPIKTSGIAGGLNPRTAIGQRADGAVLLLVIDGRQPHSLGANLKDLADIMIEHGAINAGNLDGGSSTMMYYEGKLANTCASLYGPRKIPNGFLVR